MPLEPGTTLGSYQVTAKIGEGGMGEVYRARDTKLDRDVALKVLPPAFTDDPDRLARFEREAKVLASLNHPNIGGIHGLEESDGVRALVLEYIEGPTLADRIAQGPIPIDEALPIAKQIAEALEAAHEQGVIHRDLKPANIKLKPDGTVKVLDFGLAKALDTAPEGDPSQSPTLTAAATQVGVIMGTAAYMSPEQARGKPVDKRADIWAFGAVFFEMLTGERAFGGTDVSQTLARVIEREPEWTRFPEAVTPSLRVCLQRCLQKDPRLRFRDIGDVNLAIAGAFDVPSGRVSNVTAARRWWPRLAYSVAGLAVGGFVAAIGVGDLGTPAVSSTSRYLVVPPEGVTWRAALLAPDGQKIAFNAHDQDREQIRVDIRRFDELDAVPLSGAEGLFPQAFSPDGEWLLVDGPGVMKKMALAGGPPVTIVEGLRRGIADWGPDDTIVMGSDDGLLEVSADGGPVASLTEVTDSDGVLGHLGPRVLPEGRGVLFYVWTGSAAESQVSVYDSQTTDWHTLLPGTSPQYAPSGHLVFWREGSLWAVPFDTDVLEVVGEPLPVVNGVDPGPNGFARFSLADNGTLAYLPWDAQGRQIPRTLVWVGRDGNEEPVGVSPRAYGRPRISPDGSQVVVDVVTDNGDLWRIDLETGVEERFTTDPAADQWPVWSGDGSDVFFSSTRGNGVHNLFRKPVDSTGDAVRLTSSPVRQWLSDRADDGVTFVGFEYDLTLGNEVTVVQMGGGGPTLRRLVESADNEHGAAISPDGRWVAYSSGDRSQEAVIYVAPVGAGNGGRRVIAEGQEPLWSADGRELFYRSGDSVMVVQVELGETFDRGAPDHLFSDTYASGDRAGRAWDISPDGRRFLMVKEGRSPTPLDSAFVVVENWTEELKELVPIP